MCCIADLPYSTYSVLGDIADGGDLASRYVAEIAGISKAQGG